MFKTLLYFPHQFPLIIAHQTLAYVFHRFAFCILYFVRITDIGADFLHLAYLIICFVSLILF